MLNLICVSPQSVAAGWVEGVGWWREGRANAARSGHNGACSGVGRRGEWT
jgi:hypothetical protein